MTIPIITRTNTIDEWRIQTNLMALDLNNLSSNNYTKSNGTLTLSGNSSLILSGPGTSLQVSNNALIGNDLAVTNSITVGTVGSNVGNVSIGNTLTISGRGTGLTVANNATIGKDINVVGTAYANNAVVNTNATVGGDVNVGGKVTLSGSGTVVSANNGVVYVKDAYLSNAYLTKANVSTIYALEAFIDNLPAIGSAVIDILRNTTGNIYYLSSNTLYANTGTIRDFVANGTGNVVTLSSNVATINTAIIGNLTANNGTIINGNVVTLISNNATLNNSTLLNTSISNAAISNAAITTATITTETVGTSTITNGTIINGNVVTLMSNNATLNNSTLLSSNIVSANITNANVSGNVNFTNGSTLRINSGSGNNAIIVQSGLTTLQSTVIEGNLIVSGSFTQTGNINFETDRFIFNANTPENKSAYVINQRPFGNNAQIFWNESNDRWEISTGNTWTQTYKILDGADIYTGVDSSSTTLVASASAVKFAYEAGGVIAGGYANAAYAHANSAYNQANTAYTSGGIIAGGYANAAYAHANSAYLHANAAFTSQNSSGNYANSAYIHANSVYNFANTINTVVGGYANAAYAAANSAAANANSTFIHANAAFTTANLAVVNAQLADIKATTAGAYANGAYDRANTANTNAATASQQANISGGYANSAFATANNKYDKTGGTISGDVVITGTLTVSGSGARIDANELKVADAIITLNSDILQSASPIENAGIEVDRGTSPNTYVLWNETTDKWTFTNDGTTYQNIIGATDLSTSLAPYLPLAGGTMTGALTLSGAPTSSLHAATKAYVDASLSNVDLSNLNASNLTSGTVPSARLSGTYAINISGNAATATTAGSATTASSATTAGTATNVNGGTTGTITNVASISNLGPLNNYGQIWARSGGTTTSKSDPSNLAAFKVTGDSAVSGDVYATNFYGTASSAKYADLAEKYLADGEYQEGTVMAIGGEKEITSASTLDFRALGVVSCKPAYVMNSELEGGTVIALKGRVPVRVIGKVIKGEPLGLSNEKGLARVNTINYFALSLETKNTDEEGVVEAVIL